MVPDHLSLPKVDVLELFFMLMSLDRLILRQSIRFIWIQNKLAATSIILFNIIVEYSSMCKTNSSQHNSCGKRGIM